MSTGPDLEPSLDDPAYRAERMAMMAEAAEVCRPRLFAIHGLYKDAGQGDITGWGMEFPDGLGAVYTDPDEGTVHLSSSAEGMLKVMSIIGDVSLTWLDPNPTAGQ